MTKEVGGAMAWVRGQLLREMQKEVGGAMAWVRGLSLRCMLGILILIAIGILIDRGCKSRARRWQVHSWRSWINGSVSWVAEYSGLPEQQVFFTPYSVYLASI